ncbi:type II secretion system protein [Shewanella marina]|uniref:type II secretion system protein n=1 Tax=Shewanella marina TaxID=487319 RepID=UPI00047180BF|nr:type II secretion system protein [Shewanella marina]
MKKQQGFTLIELVVVIIILGILAVVAAPKFINLQGDARVSTLKGMQAAIQSANTLVYSKASLQGLEDKAGQTVKLSNTSGDTVTTDFGSIVATKAALSKGLDVKFTEGTSPSAAEDGWIINVPKDSNTATIWQAGAPDKCTLTYTPATKADDTVTAPTFTIASASDC